MAAAAAAVSDAGEARLGGRGGSAGGRAVEVFGEDDPELLLLVSCVIISLIGVDPLSWPESVLAAAMSVVVMVAVVALW